MKLVLPQAEEKRYERIEVCLGDKVRMAEWDGIEVEGTVSKVSKEQIKVKDASFLGGAYSDDVMNYEQFKDKTEFAFNVRDLAFLKVATLEDNGPLTLINKELARNYCGSECILMSPLFHDWYKTYVKDFKMFDKYNGYKIKIDPSLRGLSVYAVPNKETIEHEKNPEEYYSIYFYKNGKLQMSNIFSCTADKLDKNVTENCNMFKSRTGNIKFAYKLTGENREVLERGTETKRYSIQFQ